MILKKPKPNKRVPLIKALTNVPSESVLAACGAKPVSFADDDKLVIEFIAAQEKPCIALEIFKAVKTECATVNGLGKKLGRLVEKGLIQRRRQSRKQGGDMNVYFVEK